MSTQNLPDPPDITTTTSKVARLIQLNTIKKHILIFYFFNLYFFHYKGEHTSKHVFHTMADKKFLTIKFWHIKKCQCKLPFTVIMTFIN
jgi:hypothetical protein